MANFFRARRSFVGWRTLLIAIAGLLASNQSSSAGSGAQMTQRVYGPDTQIVIEFGALTCLPETFGGGCFHCRFPGDCDNFACTPATARVYIVFEGSVTGRAEVNLDELAVTNFVVAEGGGLGSAFTDLPIGMTGPIDPSGVVDGVYDVVFDECEDGSFTVGQDSVVAAFEVKGANPPPCPADMVTSRTFQPPGDGSVDGADLGYLLGEWGANPGSLADIVASASFQPPPDGIVDGADLAVLLGAWGPCD